MAGLEGEGDADEGSFIELLIASERVENWVTALREHENDLNRCARAPQRWQPAPPPGLPSK